MKQNNDWTDALRDRLRDAQAEPPADGWEKLAKELAASASASPTPERPTLARRWWPAAAAAAAVLVAVLLIGRPTTEKNPKVVLAEAIAPAEKTNENTLSDTQTAESMEDETAENITTLEEARDIIRQTLAANRTGASAETPATLQPAQTDTDDEGSTSTDTDTTPEETWLADASEGTVTHKADRTDLEETDRLEALESAADQKNSFIAVDPSLKGLVAGGPSSPTICFGLHNNMGSTATTNLAYAVPEPFQSSNYAHYSNYYSSSCAPQMRHANTKAASSEGMTIAHEPEINYSLSVSIQPAGWPIRLESGLVYTRLSSTVVTATNARRQSVELVGIPLYADWPFVHVWEHVNLYAGAGILAERCVRAQLGLSRMDERPFQFSLGARLGVEYAATEHLSLNVEPHLMYHVTETWLNTSRNQKPLAPTFSLGIRYTL